MIRPQIIELLLMYFLMPVWITAGVADWVCHRMAHIERNAGPKESLLHLVMLGELAVPVCAVLFLQVNALIFLIMLVALIAHELTTLADLRYASSARLISPIEQLIHSFLEIIPLTATLFIAVLHWPEFLSLFGIGGEADFSIRGKQPPLPTSYVSTVLIAVVVFQLIPYLEELWRGVRARRVIHTK